MNYKIATLGCKVNQFETQAMETLLQKQGVTPVAEGESADLVIVNTCAVTAESGRKSRREIRKLKGENPGAVLAVCGCYSQLSPEEVRALGVEVLHGSGDKNRFISDIMAALETRNSFSFEDRPFERKIFEELPAGAVEGRTRAMLKIEDGCVNFCSYCIIPYTRGRIRSLPPERCAQNAQELSKAGFRELVITGIEIASYGKDLTPGVTLSQAIEAISEKSGEMRLRLGSLEPTVVTREFCQGLSKSGKICDHFHLSLQSGCDETLLRMNRKYNCARFLEACELLREFFPDCGLTADLIVGFPGETEENHRETLEFLRKCGFSKVHIFPYSIRPGTKAAEMPNQLTAAEKARRAGEAKIVAAEVEQEFLNSCVGKKLSVLFETEQNGMSVGHADNYAQVCVSGGQLHGIVKCVQITAVSGEMLVGKLV
ncbi:MAG: tRNA (N(6)-L-threonylcarbamoyladenosine(37)-C(2))-methylthiotransferase MtaB [Oscillospiraceae bacterium]